MKIYIVRGACGDENLYREWDVCAYWNEDVAKEHAKRAEQWSQNQNNGSRFQLPNMNSPYDPNFSTDIGGTFYSVHELDLLNKLLT